MPDYQALTALVRGSQPGVIPAVWDFFPCHAGAVGGVPNFLTYYFDADEKLRLQLRLKELLPEALILPGVFPDFGVIVEVSAFGGRIQWFENGAPYIGEVVRGPRDIDALKPPRPGLDGLMPLVLVQREAMRRTLKARGIEMERWAMTMGPAEVAGLLMGYERFYLAMYDDPARLAALMRLVTDFLIGWLRTQDAAAGGAEAVCVADHVVSQVPPALVRELILPHERAIFAEFPHAVRIYHNEGRHSDEHIAMVLEFGADVWHFGSDAHALPDLYARVGDRIVLFGGLDPHGVIRRGTPDGVRAASREVLRQAAGRRLLLSSGTGTTPDTSLENLRAMVEAVTTQSSP
ncbi:MAG TPA: uroporphyrinogen decarboxylase family protein [Planctomycetota bacterium]|nr:uroporphyrinogen decarboxylase family protein [Planctomycetota bacterium]